MNKDENNFEGMSVFDIIQLLIKRQTLRKEAAIKANKAEAQKKDKLNSIR